MSNIQTPSRSRVITREDYTMTDFIDVLVPTAPANVRQQKMAKGVDDLAGKRIGLVDNRKPNFDIFLARLEEILCERYQFANIVHLKKSGTGATVPMTPEEMGALTAKCDAVVYGVCD
jgi:hypothetical protein